MNSLWGNSRNEAFFRKTFNLPARPQKAFLRISVDTGYELFINGRLVAAVDEWNNTRDYEVALFLQRGINLIAVHGVNHAGHRCFALALRTDASSEMIVSDTSWKVSDREVWGWQLPEFDDSGWEAAIAQPLRFAGAPQWQGVPGDGRFALIPVLQCSPFFAGAIPKGVDSPFHTARTDGWSPDPEVVAVVGSGYTDSVKSVPEQFPCPALIFPVENSGGRLTGQTFTVPQTARYTGPALIVDFGREVVGHFRMRLKSESSVSFRLHFGETISECLSEPPRDVLQHRMLTEEVRLFSGEREYECRTRVGFRFVRMEFFDCQSPVEASSFGLRSEVYPVSYRGYFHCSDELLNDIWRTGRKTLHFCMQEYYLDAVKRDRMLWVGDTRAEALYNYYLFGDTALFRFCWDEMAKCAYADGAIPSAWGEGSSLLWDYNAWWVVAFHDYYLHSGDADFLRKHADSICRATDFMLPYCGKDGLYSLPENPYPSWMVVLDNAVGVSSFHNALFLRALETALEACELSGNTAGAEKYRNRLAVSRPAIEALLTREPVYKSQSQRVHSTGCHEIAETLFADGRSAEALDFIREYWGKMLRETESDTLSEGFYKHNSRYASQNDPEASATFISYCHGWTAGPNALLPREVAGIRPLEPSFRRFTVAPAMADLTSLQAVVPTPHGEIAISLQQTDGQIRGSLLVPEGCTAEVTVNASSRQLSAGMHRI